MIDAARLARRILSFEDEPPGVGAIRIPTNGEQIFQRLRDRLQRLIGPGGFEALVSRSLFLARQVLGAASFASLSTEGTVVVAATTRAEAEAFWTELLSQFIGLLTNFIGEDLTLRLLHEVWPDLDVQGGGR
jgi:hypothetical protein